MEEKLFLFNPFNIKNINEKELASMYQEVFKKINNNICIMEFNIFYISIFSKY